VKQSSAQTDCDLIVVWWMYKDHSSHSLAYKKFHDFPGTPNVFQDSS